MSNSFYGTDASEFFTWPGDPTPGADIIELRGGDDGVTLNSSQVDVVFGGDGNDVILDHASPSSSNSDQLFGGAGNDTLVSWFGSHLLDGGPGIDFYDVRVLSMPIGRPTIVVSGGTETVLASATPDITFSVNVSGLTFSDVTQTVSGGINTIAFGNSGATIVLNNGFNDPLPASSFAGLQPDTFAGTAGADIAWSNGFAQTMYGGDGNDVLSGEGGNDVMYGDNDADLLNGGAHDDMVYGGDGNDIVRGGTEHDTLYGGAGDDTVVGETGRDWIYGGSGNDVLYGGAEPAAALFGGDAFVIEQNSGTDTIMDFEVGTDVLWPSASYTVSWSNVGADKVLNFIGLNTTVVLAGHAGTGIDQFMLSGISDPADPIGPAGPQQIFGHADTDNLVGGGGDDRVSGEGGDDKLWGGTDNDLVNGGQGADTVYGGSGDDHVRGGTENDTMFGGDGHDIVVGEGGDDSLIGGAGNDTMWGEAGADTFFVRTGDGSDTIADWQDGIDKIDLTDVGVEFFDIAQSTAAGARVLVLGGTGMSLVLSGQAGTTIDGSDFIGLGAVDPSNPYNGPFGTGGSDILYGGPGDVGLSGEGGDDTMYGAGGNDDVNGGPGSDRIYGDSGNDTLRGGSESDTLYGGSGNDIVVGGSGDDTLTGGLNNDTLWGEDGADVFRIRPGGSGTDTIMDFQGGLDVVRYDLGMGAPAIAGNVASFVDGTSIVAGNSYNWVIGDFQAV